MKKLLSVFLIGSIIYGTSMSELVNAESAPNAGEQKIVTFNNLPEPDWPDE
ncbi:hypothetical protein V1503_24350 [Bacillus sp. SCS-151]|uniref:hypothetical protein n=1 Tax=Nanhaiella sioensis TaxID=3115293 RepID=UPI0039794A8C